VHAPWVVPAFADGLAPPHYKYHLAPDGLMVGDVLQAGKDAPIQAGSTLKLKDIPMGVHIHNIELVRTLLLLVLLVLRWPSAHTCPRAQSLGCRGSLPARPCAMGLLPSLGIRKTEPLETHSTDLLYSWTDNEAA